MQLTIRNLVKRYGEYTAVDDVSLAIEDGQFVVILGPSGCGKTTTLRTVAGFERPDAGTIHVGDRTVNDPANGIIVPPEKRGLGMVFQSYAIWPHMTVYENVALGLKVRRLRGAEVASRVKEALGMVGLGHLADRPAAALSGGQMQRVALARSLVIAPGVLLLDEPLSNLDAKLRERIRVELKEIQRKTGVTSLYVTHDQVEAAVLGDRVAVMNDGKVMQFGSPEELWCRPANRFVADFLGRSNIVTATVAGATGTGYRQCMAEGGLSLVAAGDETYATGQSVYLSIRPQDVRLQSVASTEQPNSLAGVVAATEYLGAETNYTLTIGNLTLMGVESGSRPRFRTGDTVAVHLNPDHIHLMRE